jgi:hypothetical protein
LGTNQEEESGRFYFKKRYSNGKWSEQTFSITWRNQELHKKEVSISKWPSMKKGAKKLHTPAKDSSSKSKSIVGWYVFRLRVCWRKREKEKEANELR